MAKAAKKVTKKAAAATEDQAAAPAASGQFEAKQEFTQWAGEEAKTFKVGDDVSHLPAKKIDEYMQAGLVKKSPTEQAKENEDKAHKAAAEK